jgi:hypothetical protein
MVDTAALPDWQQAICREVRDLVHAADPEVTETIKRTTRPYFVLQCNVAALLAAKDHVNVFLYDGALVPRSRGNHHRGARQRRSELAGSTSSYVLNPEAVASSKLVLHASGKTFYKQKPAVCS